MSIPSPEINSFNIGPVTIYFYALCIMVGIIAAAFLVNRRLTKMGAEPWVVLDLILLTVPLGIIGARIFHVLTHPNDYFYPGANLWEVFDIRSGGIAIFGALIGGAVGAWLGCRWRGLRFWAFADALAPGLLLAQAFGRFGNYFNQELFGTPTDLPWGLEIDSTNAAWPLGLPAGTLFHPTFLYEVIWNLLGVALLLWLTRKIAIGWGKLFGVYLIWYGAGRVVWESIRIDPSEIFLGVRVNVWAALLALIVGIVLIIVQNKRHTGLIPSPYVPGRGWKDAEAGVGSSHTDVEYVDTTDPSVPATAPVAESATSRDGATS
ncbi:prolipoprotein diacylglyceryl transferase [Mycetocola tolaasinivorans]|uniref:Phosphatidylglycerol--prolipoprotein diacylglyceryl transferase n=1 Tax=Mycetocola tolaasinivorans TaxID=76635 RepID=A0A3L7AA59_9MICO|nr:prolipoprotein diacylglyceryl transferase [Mycetocola tolaasinivorans]RLP77087.1 prolipoprotein diacylglyceryl transferase [Mycetocola tolaasinivorans]